MSIRTFDDVRTTLMAYTSSKLQRKAYTLEHMTQLLDFLGNPQETYRVVHAAGTSGKTSTVYYIAALLQRAGCGKIGLTVSPHTIEINDRVQINGQPMPEAIFCAELERFLAIIAKSGITPTYFELMVAFAFWEFSQQGVDVAVVEVGVGGLLDGTNVVHRQDKVCVITDIGFDHTRLLGNTLSEIATQKAGIIQAGNSVFMYEQAPEVMDVVYAAARRKHADVHSITAADVQAPDYLPLFQQRNFGLARVVVDTVWPNMLTDAMARDAAQITIPGRMEVFSYHGKTIILDGAHNGQKLAALAESLEAKQYTSIAFLVGFIAGHETKRRMHDAWQKIGAMAQQIVATQFGDEKDHPRQSLSADAVISDAKAAGLAHVNAIKDPTEALASLLDGPDQTIVVTGSLYLLNHIRPQVLAMIHTK